MRKRIILQTVGAVPVGYCVVTPPRSVSASPNDNQYHCGRCSTILLVAQPGQPDRIVIECRKCGALNKADI
jgi:hypothetical protein